MIEGRLPLPTLKAAIVVAARLAVEEGVLLPRCCQPRGSIGCRKNGCPLLAELADLSSFSLGHGGGGHRAPDGHTVHNLGKWHFGRGIYIMVTINSYPPAGARRSRSQSLPFLSILGEPVSMRKTV